MVYHDNGSHFTGGTFKDMLRRRGVFQFTAAITHPSSVGLAENGVKQVLNQLRKALQNDAQLIFDWDMGVEQCVAHLNSRFMRVHGYSPAELLFGFKPRYVNGLETFEGELRSAEIHTRVSANLPMEDKSLEEACYTARLSAMDEIRDLSSRSLLNNQEYIANRSMRSTKTSYGGKPGPTPSSGAG